MLRVVYGTDRRTISRQSKGWVE